MTSKRQLRVQLHRSILRELALAGENELLLAEVERCNAECGRLAERVAQLYAAQDSIVGFPVEVDPLRQPSEAQQLAAALQAANVAAAVALAALSPAVSS